jgi:hypothetical protein
VRSPKTPLRNVFCLNPQQNGWWRSLSSMKLPGARRSPNTQVALISLNGTAFNTSGQQASLFGDLESKKNYVVADMAARTDSRKASVPGVGAKEQVMEGDEKGRIVIREHTPGGHSLLVGQALGFGVDENVDLIIETVKNMKKEGINHLHFQAWSRGNEAALRAIDRIAKDQKLAEGLTMSVFGHDPVPGPLRFGKYPRVPSQVKRCTIVLASEETMPLGLFNAIIPDLRAVPEVFITTFPTNHSGAAGINEVADHSKSAMSRIIRDLSEKSFQEWGGVVEYALNLSNREILNDYATITRRKLQLGGVSNVRRLIHQYEGYTSTATTVANINQLQLPDQTNAWINSHHLLTFNEEFPLLFKVFVAGNGNFDRAALGCEMEKLHHELPTTFDNLQHVFRTPYL